MRNLVTLLVALAVAAWLATGCARHVHHHGASADKVVVLDEEHADPKVVVVHKKPAPARHCWRHRRHWHCRR